MYKPEQVTPYGSFVLISFDVKEEEVTEGGIIIPTGADPVWKVMEADVLEVGDKVKEDGVIKKGDHVLVPTDVIGIDMDESIEGEDTKHYRIAAVENIVAILGS